MRMNFEQKRKLLLFLKFLEGGGEEGTFFQGRFPLGTKIRKKVSPAPLSKKL
jgi:hypothetical protein